MVTVQCFANLIRATQSGSR